jgi:hypothetical protein
VSQCELYNQCKGFDPVAKVWVYGHEPDPWRIVRRVVRGCDRSEPWLVDDYGRCTDEGSMVTEMRVIAVKTA